MKLPFFNPIWKLVMLRLKQMIREAEVEFKNRRAELKAEYEEKQMAAAEDLVKKIIRF